MPKGEPTGAGSGDPQDANLDIQAKLIFDPKRDVSGESMQRMIRNAEHSGNRKPFFAYKMKIIDPTYEPKIEEDVQKSQIEKLEKNRREGNWQVFAYQAMIMKIIDPTYDLKLDEDAARGMSSTLESTRRGVPGEFIWGGGSNVKSPGARRESEKDHEKDAQENKWMHFVRMAANVKIANPQQELGVDQEARQGIKDRLEKLKKEYSSEFLRDAMAAKIVDSTLDLGLDQPTQAWIKNIFQELKSPYANIDTFTDTLMAMKILAAEKVEVTDKGLEIIMPEEK